MKTVGDKFSFQRKWSPEIEAYGFLQVPNLLVTCQGHLGLSDGEFVVLMQLIKFWYHHGGEVYPSITTLSKYSNKGYSTTQRKLCSLERKGFIKRRRGLRVTNTYDLKYCAIKLYNHQKKCTEITQKRGVTVSKVSSTDTSISINKEYEAIRRQNLSHWSTNSSNFLEFDSDGSGVIL
jgi:hypothetical protein